MCDMCVGKTSWCISLAQSIAYLSALKVDDLNESFPLRRCWCSTIHQYLHTGAEGRGFSIMCPGVPVSRCPGGPCSWLSASHLRTEGGGRFSVCLLAPSKWQQNVAISLRGFLYSQLSGSLDFLPACLQSLQGGVCSRGPLTPYRHPPFFLLSAKFAYNAQEKIQDTRYSAGQWHCEKDEQGHAKAS